MTDQLLAIEGLAVSLGGRESQLELLSRVDLSLPRGGSLGVVGETGSGKTVTARAITGLLPRIGARVTRGSIMFDGVDLVTLTEAGWRRLRGRRIALVPQSSLSSLDPLMRIDAQLAETISRLTDHPKPRHRALELLELVEIARPASVLEAYPHELSGGMRQRVMIALAIAGHPALVVADEPTTALDVTVQRVVLELLAARTREAGMSLILVSHDLEVVRAYCDSVAIMYAGMTVESGPTHEVLTSPAHPYTRALLAARPAEAAPGELLQAIPGTPPGVADRPAGCRFAPRCPIVIDACHARLPDSVLTGEGRRAACIRVPERIA